MKVQQLKVDDETVEAFNKGFSDYIVKLPSLNKCNFENKMIKPSCSNIKFSSICIDGRIVAGVILAGNEGTTTMINAMCVVPEYRGSTAAALLMDRTAQLAPMGELELEVFEGNKRAIGFYKKYGFKEMDKICYMVGKIPDRQADISGEIRDIPYNELIMLQNWIDVPLNWQSRLYCLLNQDISVKGYYLGESLLGFIVYTEYITVSVKQIYVLREARNKGIGYKLLKNASNHKLCSCIFIENTEGWGFYKSLNFVDKMHLLRMQFDL